jgi:hypothetical protein
MNRNYAQSTKSWCGLAFADLQQVCKDPDQIVAVKTLGMTPDKKWTQADVMTGTTAMPDGFRRPGALSVKGKIDAEFYAEGAIPRLIAGIMGAPVITKNGATAAYTAVFKHGDAVNYPEGFALTEVMDKDNGDQFNYCGCQVDGMTLDFSKDEAIKFSASITGNEGNHGIGTAATSTSSSAISFPVTIGAAEKITIAANGGTGIDVAITAGTYTAVQLAAMVNANILALATLQNDVIDKRPVVAAYVNSSNKLVIYTDKKGTGATLHVTNGNADIDFASPVEVAGTATPVIPSYPVIISTTKKLQPLIGTGATVLYNGAQIPAEKVKIDFKNNFKKDNFLGVNYPIQNVLNGRFMITGSIEFKVTTDNQAYWDSFLNDTAAALEIDMETGVLIDTGYNYGGKIKLPLIKLTKNDKPKSALPGAITQTLTFEAYYDAVTATDCEIDLTNSEAVL